MILSILKVIGIVILVILVLLIFILGIVLFVPIRYQFNATYEDEPEAAALVKWSPILLKVTWNYRNSQSEYIVKMLGGVVKTNQDIPLSWIGRKYFSSDDEDDLEEDWEDDIGLDKRKQSRESKGKEKRTSGKKDFVVLDDEIEMEGPASSSKDLTEKQKESPVTTKTIQQKKKEHYKPSFIKKIQQKFRDIKQKIQQFIHKLQTLNEKREALLKVYHHKRFEVAKKDAIIYIKELWNVIKPKHLEGRIHFGMEDPATTGQVLGIMAMFLVWYYEFLQIEPDFEKKALDGYLKGDGKIRLFPVVKLIIKVLLNKNLIKVIKKVQTIIEA